MSRVVYLDTLLLDLLMYSAGEVDPESDNLNLTSATQSHSTIVRLVPRPKPYPPFAMRSDANLRAGVKTPYHRKLDKSRNRILDVSVLVRCRYS